MTDSQQLLAEYVRSGSDAVFRQLVAQHVNLVYAVALRLVGGDPHRAQDVAQTVFVDLSRSAQTIPPQAVLAGWLHRRTCFVAANLMRGERRRQSRERQAVEMNMLLQSPEPDFSTVAPELDEAINELGDDDRTAILLRFFEQRDFRSVGAALGSNEDAARMRVSRALEKLETLLKRRGVTTTAALATVLFANAAPAAPIGLAATISTAAALTATALTTSTVTIAKTVAMTTLQKTLVAATVAALAGFGIYETRQASQLREKIESLQLQQTPILEQLQQAQQQRDDATQQLAGIQGENDRLNRNTMELVRLRSQMAAYAASASSPAIQVTPLEPLQRFPMDTNQFAPLSSDRAPEALSYSPRMLDLASTNYHRVTNALANAKTPLDRYLVLGQAAKLAFVFGDIEDARKYATEALALDQSLRGPLWDGEAVFSGNLVLGRIALQEGQTDEAKRYLLKAGQTPGSPSLNAAGPNMTLARDLLRAGEQEAVLEYFELCKKFWSYQPDNQLAKWSRDVRAGNMPDFGANIYY